MHSIWMGSTGAPKPLLMWCSIQHHTCLQLPTIKHNRIRDLTAQLLTKVCPSVEVEPHLQPLSGETFQNQTTNVEENARLDVKALGFWGNKRLGAFFDVGCLTHLHHPMPTRPSNPPTERVKRRKESNMRIESSRLSMALSHP